MYAFEIELGRIKDCTQCAKDVGIPMLEEYEYLKDELTPSLKISLKGHAKIRDYQRLALNKMFSHSRSRSGIIVLPCGSGKTIVGITAAVTIKKSCLCLVTGGVSVEQWKAQFEHFTNIPIRDPFRGDHFIVLTINLLSFRQEADILIRMFRHPHRGAFILRSLS